MQTSAPKSPFFFGRRIGTPIVAGDVELTPQSLVLVVHLGHWGYVWNWPIAISVTRSGQADRGSGERIAIVDATRLALWSLGLAATIMALGFSFLPDKRVGKSQ